MLFPIRRPRLFALYEQMVHCFWTPYEIDFSKDRQHFQALPPAVRDFIGHTLMFFASSDTLVMESVGCNLVDRIKWPEARQCFALQMQQEAVHTHVYCLLIEALVPEVDHLRFFTALQTNPVVQQKSSFVMKYMGAAAERTAVLLLAQACFEGISFSSSFASIYWLKQLPAARDLKALFQANHLIARDEGVHLKCVAEMYAHLPAEEKLTAAGVEAIIRDAVSVEYTFADQTMPLQQLGMNADVIKRYVNSCGNYVSVLFGGSRLFDDSSVPEFCEHIGLQTKSNFFEDRETSYQTGFRPVFETNHDF